MKVLFKKRYVRVVATVLAAILISLLAEMFFNIKVLSLKPSQKGILPVELSQCTTEHISMTDEAFYIKRGGSICFEVNGYVDRLSVAYESDEAYIQNLKIKYKNRFGREQIKEIKDVNPVYLKETVINIKKYVYEIAIEIPKDYEELRINSISIKNTAVFNHIRVIYLILGLSSIGLVIILRDVIAKKIHIGFAITAGCVGLSLVISMPLVRVGYDEEAHFRNCFVLSVTGHTVENDTLWDMLNTEPENHPAVRTATYEEYKAFYKYLNENALYTDNGKEPFRYTKRTTSGMATFSYVFMALAMSIARFFKMGFADIYILGRLVNLAVYVTVMTFAIKNVKKCKLLFATVGLLPTVIFLSSSISYDPVTISFIALGLSFFLNAIYEDDEMTWKKFLSSSFFLGYGCSAKAVYAPLFLLGFMIPKEKYKNKKTKIIMRAGYVLCMLVLMATFVLPVLLGRDGGDTRGGATSNQGQLSYILGNPFGYLFLVIKSVATTFQRFTLSGNTIDDYYFLGNGQFSTVMTAILLTVIITHGRDCFEYKKKDRGIILAISGVITLLIWTAFYMTFTMPGDSSGIYGVQGRYFIPLYVLLFGVFIPRKIKCEWDRKNMYATVFSLMSFVLSFEIYSQVILNSCG